MVSSHARTKGVEVIHRVVPLGTIWRYPEGAWRSWRHCGRSRRRRLDVEQSDRAHTIAARRWTRLASAAAHKRAAQICEARPTTIPASRHLHAASRPQTDKVQTRTRADPLALISSAPLRTTVALAGAAARATAVRSPHAARARWRAVATIRALIATRATRKNRSERRRWWRRRWRRQ